MEYRILGRSGIRVSAVALGCEGFMEQSAESVRQSFDYAIAEGINFIDIYSPNPDLRRNIGAALEGRRREFIIQGHLCTVWENGQYLRTRETEKIMPAFERQLKELQTDYLDIGMIHYVDASDDFQRVFNGGIIDIAEQLKAEGRIRAIGMSSHNPEVARMAVETGKIDVLMFSINPCYDLLPASEDVEQLFEERTFERRMQNIYPQRERLYELCERAGVGIDVMKVYAGGNLLSAESSPLGTAMTTVQCIEYALARPAVAAVMIGAKDVAEIGTATAWCKASAAERDYASVFTGQNRFSWQGRCMYCGHCAPCSAGIEIAMVNKLYNLTTGQNEIPETVREHYRVLKHHASDCVECGLCETRCPFGVAVTDSMRKAAERFGY